MRDQPRRINLTQTDGSFRSKYEDAVADLERYPNRRAVANLVNILTLLLLVLAPAVVWAVYGWAF